MDRRVSHFADVAAPATRPGPRGQAVGGGWERQRASAPSAPRPRSSPLAGPWARSALLLLAPWGIGMGSANVRPQALTTLLLAVCALLITMYKEGRSRALWPLPPLLA